MSFREWTSTHQMTFAFRFSRKAKELLSKYDIIPVPKIIEVDLRGTSLTNPIATLALTFLSLDDADLIKALLTRLTSHSTFPNIILRGKSLGGSEDLQALHSQGKLRKVLEEGGLKVEGEVP